MNAVDIIPSTPISYNPDLDPSITVAAGGTFITISNTVDSALFSGSGVLVALNGAGGEFDPYSIDTSASSPGGNGNKLMGKAGYLDFLDPGKCTVEGYCPSHPAKLVD